MGLVLLGVAAGLLLVCGGVGGGAYFAVKGLLRKGADALSQAQDNFPTPGGPGIQPPPPDGGKPVEPKDNGLDVRFVPTNFTAGAVVHPARLVKSPLLTSVLPEEILTAMGAETGIDPKKVERLLVLAEPTPGGSVLFFPAGVVRFAEDVDGKAILTKVLKDVQEVSADGKSYFSSKTEKMAKTPIAGHVADARTLVIAPEPTLKKMLAAKGDGPLAKQLLRLDLGSDLAAVFVLEPVKELAGQALKENKDALPPQVGDVGKLHEQVKAATVALNFSGETLVKITLETDSEDSAGRLAELLGKGKEMLLQAYPDMKKDMVPGLPPALAKDIVAVIDQVPTGISVSRSGPTVTAELKNPKGLAELAPKVAPLLMGGEPSGAVEWKPFTSREDGFSVRFPGVPKKMMQPGRNSADYQVALDGGTTIYAVNCTTAAVDQSGNARTILAAITRNFGKAVKSASDVTIRGTIPGKALELEMENGGIKMAVLVRVYIVGTRTYTLQVTSLPSKKDPTQASRFFDSFSPMPAAPPVPVDTAPVTGLPLKPLPRSTATGGSLKGDTKAVMDLSVTGVKIEPKTTLPCLTWADDRGSAFYVLGRAGELRRVTFPDFKEEWKLDLGERCAWMSMSSEGLLVTLASQPEVWLIDPEKGEMKGRFPVPGCKRAVSAPKADVGVALTGTGLHVLDLKKMTATRFTDPVPLRRIVDDVALSPDGKYVFTAGLGKINRYALADGKFRFEESSGPVLSGRVDTGITFSPDGKQVCAPSYVGGGTGKNYTLSVYKVDDLKSPELVLDPGGTAIGFDPNAGSIYVNALHLFNSKGKLIKSYNLGGDVIIMSQILVHPAGGPVLVMASDQLVAVTVPKGGGK